MGRGDQARARHSRPRRDGGLPAALTAWTGLDAFVHAGGSTNVRHAWNDLYAHAALTLIAGALETAVRDPQSRRAEPHAGRRRLCRYRARQCSAAMAHNISHALAALGPVHHGLATALALEVILGWQVAADDGAFAAAAEACGLARDATALPGWYSEFLTRCGVERRLPPPSRRSARPISRPRCARRKPSTCAGPRRAR